MQMRSLEETADFDKCAETSQRRNEILQLVFIQDVFRLSYDPLACREFSKLVSPVLHSGTGGH